jgi:hypothetical protein
MRTIKLCLVSLLAVGCLPAPGDYENGSEPGDPDGGEEASACTTSEVTARVFSRCTGGACHDSDQPARGLDLLSAGVENRLIDVASTGCVGEMLVIAGDPANSHLYEKLAGTQTCGERMPKGGTPLSAEDLNCVSDWIAAMTPGGSAGGGTGGGTGGGDTGGGTGGGGGGGW